MFWGHVPTSTQGPGLWTECQITAPRLQSCPECGPVWQSRGGHLHSHNQHCLFGFLWHLERPLPYWWLKTTDIYLLSHGSRGQKCMSRLSVGLGSLQTLGENLVLAPSSSWWLWLFLGGVCTIPICPHATATMPSLLHQSFACLSSKRTFLIVFTALLIV